jgi:hypothetical protein
MLRGKVAFARLRIVYRTGFGLGEINAITKLDTCAITRIGKGECLKETWTTMIKCTHMIR